MQDAASRLLGRRRTDLEFQDPGALVGNLADVLSDMQTTCATVGEALTTKHFQAGHAVGWAVEAG